MRFGWACLSPSRIGVTAVGRTDKGEREKQTTRKDRHVTKRILFLFSDTGGGHRSAFQAIRDAMIIRYGDAVQFEAVDVLRECKWPLNKQPELYPASSTLPSYSGRSFIIASTASAARASPVR